MSNQDIYNELRELKQKHMELCDRLASAAIAINQLQKQIGREQAVNKVIGFKYGNNNSAIEGYLLNILNVYHTRDGLIIEIRLP